MQIKKDGKIMKQITVNLSKEIVDWIDKKVQERIFASRSHAVEACLFWNMQREQDAKEVN
jgi:Arc/MetJ-type ribon-helix-helix transcriptional regulator